MKKGITIWSFPKQSLEENFALAKKAGYQGVELSLDEKGEVSLDSTKEEMEAHFIKEWERGVKLCCGLPNLFPDALAYLMDKTCITNEDLADKAWLDVRTIQRLRTDTPIEIRTF